MTMSRPYSHILVLRDSDLPFRPWLLRFLGMVSTSALYLPNTVVYYLYHPILPLGVFSISTALSLDPILLPLFLFPSHYFAGISFLFDMI